MYVEDMRGRSRGVSFTDHIRGERFYRVELEIRDIQDMLHMDDYNLKRQLHLLMCCMPPDRQASRYGRQYEHEYRGYPFEQGATSSTAEELRIIETLREADMARKHVTSSETPEKATSWKPPAAREELEEIPDNPDVVWNDVD